MTRPESFHRAEVRRLATRQSLEAQAIAARLRDLRQHGISSHSSLRFKADAIKRIG